MAGRRARSALLWAGLGLALTASCSGTPPPHPSPPPLSITINGAPHQVPPGTTLGRLLSDLHLRPAEGRLLSVTGEVLTRHAFPGTVELNGVDAPHGSPLAAGDAVSVVDGKDQTEPTRKETLAMKGFHPLDPQRTLATYPVKQVRVVGRVSESVLSVDYRPTGKPKVPREVALTFDDGPWPNQTRKVLSILKHHHVRATFFMIGENVAKWPAIAQDVQRAGMTIGNHTWDHPQDPGLDSLTEHRIQTELTETTQSLRGVAVKPFLFRPPGGVYDDRVVQEARREGLRVILWSIDTQDWRSGRTAKEITHTVLSQVQPGSIVLMHDGGGNRKATINALPAIIKGIRKKGLKLVTIPR
jgi:peptidoglycan/xylan/chitin deacetylase (PgdA/CDA1 family)/sulfur carrier protein ThiS